MIATTTLQAQLVAYRRELHSYPELSLQEYETTNRIEKWLKEIGITTIQRPLKTGLVADIQGTLPGPTIALRADIDALPIDEINDLPFASKHEGVMHACGHDFHTAAILGAAILLHEQRASLKGNVRLIFQPAEEFGGGAHQLVQQGVLEGVDVIFGMHNKPDLAVGEIGIKSGPLMASVDRFEINIKGIGGHAGIPNETIDPIVAGSQIVTALQSIVSRSVSPLHQAVVSVTKFQAGNTWNVIPENAVLEGTVRTFHRDDRQFIEQKMRAIIEGFAHSLGAECEFNWHRYVPAVDNDAQFEKTVIDTAKQIGASPVVADLIPAGEDFSVYQQYVPSYFVFVGVDGPYNWHHPKFTLNEDALSIAARYFAQLVTNVQQNSF